MAEFGDYEHDLILRQTVQAAARHAYGVTGSDQRGFDPGDVLDMLAPRQMLALHRLANRADLNRDGTVDYGRRVGPRLPGSRARDLKEALHGILAVQAATASAPPQRQLTAGEQHLDSGLRSLFAEQELQSFTDRNGIGRRLSSGLVQDRTTDSRVDAPAASAMVDNLAKATNSSRRDVLTRMLSTPADQRFDLAASMMVGRGEGMSSDHRDHAHNRMADTMNQQFSRLGKTANRYNRIGQRWKSQNRLVKGAVYLGVAAAVVSQPWLLPVLVAGRFVHPIQRLQRLGRELGASARGSRSVGQARKILDHEHTVAGRLAGGRQAAMVQAPQAGPGQGQPAGVQAPGAVHVPGVGPDGRDLTAQGPNGQPVRTQEGPGQNAGVPMPDEALQGQPAADGRVPMPAEALRNPAQQGPGQQVPAQGVGAPDLAATGPVVVQPGQPAMQAPADVQPGQPAPAELRPAGAAGPEGGTPQPTAYPPVPAPIGQTWNQPIPGAEAGSPMPPGFAPSGTDRSQVLPAGRNGGADQPQEVAAGSGESERSYHGAHRAEDRQPVAATDGDSRGGTHRAAAHRAEDRDPAQVSGQPDGGQPESGQPGGGQGDGSRGDGGQGGSNAGAGQFSWPGALDVSGGGQSEADRQLWTAAQAANAGVAGARPGTKAAAEATTKAGRSGGGQGRGTATTETER